MSEEKRARHVIRGWDGIRTFTGYGRTQLQDMIARGDFPIGAQNRSMTGDHCPLGNCCAGRGPATIPVREKNPRECSY